MQFSLEIWWESVDSFTPIETSLCVSAKCSNDGRVVNVLVTPPLHVITASNVSGSDKFCRLMRWNNKEQRFISHEWSIVKTPPLFSPRVRGSPIRVEMNCPKPLGYIGYDKRCCFPPGPPFEVSMSIFKQVSYVHLMSLSLQAMKRRNRSCYIKSINRCWM